MSEMKLTDADLARLEEMSRAVAGSINYIEGNLCMTNAIAKYMGTLLDAVPSLVAEVRALRRQNLILRNGSKVVRDDLQAENAALRADLAAVKTKLEPCNDCWTMKTLAREMGITDMRWFYRDACARLESMKQAEAENAALREKVEVLEGPARGHPMTAVTELESALAVFRAIAEQGDEQERALADRLTSLIRATDRERRRARLAGTRMLRQARRYKAAAKMTARGCNMGAESKVEWNKYDGTEESMPELFHPVLIYKPGHPQAGVFSGHAAPLGMWWGAVKGLPSGAMEPGDLWALYPSAPEEVDADA